MAEHARDRATSFPWRRSMKPVAFLAAALLSFPAASFAVDSSPRCDALPAAEKDQCLKDELAKTDSKAAPETAASGGSAPSQRAYDKPGRAPRRRRASGGSAPSERPYDNADRSPRCDRLSGAEKDQCLKDEAAKTETK